jgi:hypothetical protein
MKVEEDSKEAKKEQDEEASQARILDTFTFATSQWCQIDDEDVEMGGNIVLKMPRIRPTCCITYAVIRGI